MRTLQGLAGGALPPMLMTWRCASPANIKLYGLGRLCPDRHLRAQPGHSADRVLHRDAGLALDLLAGDSAAAVAACVSGAACRRTRSSWRFRVFDWRGLLLGAPALAMLVIGLLQGERLDWLNSPLIRVLLGGGGALFLLNEWFHPLPFFKIQLCATATSATRCSRWAACWWCCWA